MADSVIDNDKLANVNPLFCNICQIMCNSAQSFQGHIAGKKHIAKVGKGANACIPPPPSFNSSPAVAPVIPSVANDSVSTTELDVVPSVASNPVTSPVIVGLPARELNLNSRSKALRCEICGKLYNGIQLYIMHCESRAHKRMVSYYEGTGRPLPNLSAPLVSRRLAAAVGQPLPNVPAQLVTMDDSTNSANSNGDEPSEIVEFGRVELDKLKAKLHTPVGMEYIDEVEGQLGSFHCRLCNCRLGDIHSRDMHVTGRRHRAEYRRHVDPDFDRPMKKRKIPPPLPSSGISAKRREKKMRKMQSMQENENLSMLNMANEPQPVPPPVPAPVLPPISRGLPPQHTPSYNYQMV